MFKNLCWYPITVNGRYPFNIHQMNITFPCLVTRLSQMNGLSHCRSGTLNVLDAGQKSSGELLDAKIVGRLSRTTETNITWLTHSIIVKLWVRVTYLKSKMILESHIDLTYNTFSTIWFLWKWASTCSTGPLRRWKNMMIAVVSRVSHVMSWGEWNTRAKNEWNNHM